MTSFSGWMLRIAIGMVALVGIVLLVVAFMSWQTGRDVEKRIEELRAAGDPVTFKDLIPEKVDPATNAATYLQRAFKDCGAISAELRPLSEDRQKFYRDARDEDSGKNLNEAGALRVREAIEAYPDVIPMLVKASNCPVYVSPLDLTGDFSSVMESTLDHQGIVREACRVLHIHARQLDLSEQHDDAIDAGLAIMRLARLYDAEPFLVGRLVAIAVRGMACDSIALTILDGPVSDESRLAIEQELARQDALPGCEFGLKSERVMTIHGFRERVPFPARFLAGFVKDELDAFDIYEELIEMSDQPKYKVSARLAAVQAQASQAGVLTRLLSPALVTSRAAEDRTRAVMRCTRVLAALDGFLQEDAAATPTLDALDVPKDAKIDPYTGDPIRLKKTDGGWIVYSVGADLVDNGGKLGFVTTTDIGFGPLKR